MSRPKFDMGRVVMTHGVESSLPILEVLEGLARHAQGDWGDLDKHDQEANNEALSVGGRLFSSYKTKEGVAFWIITEWVADERSNVTTVLTPGEY